ncbi:MAG: hypothetical protein JXA99_02025 [Candidatus Lokiarchaeota archaeon]|nr:hypothetical protein [Candidatus Lokiarchaeota archaeon]
MELVLNSKKCGFAINRIKIISELNSKIFPCNDAKFIDITEPIGNGFHVLIKYNGDIYDITEFEDIYLKIIKVNIRLKKLEVLKYF